MPTLVTQSIRVSVRAEYLADASNPKSSHYLFAYHVNIANEGDEFVQLLSRHWIIKDAHDNVEEVRGDGVIGQQPLIAPGDAFPYTSACPLGTEWGIMRGTYLMARMDGEIFPVAVPAFALLPPHLLN